MFYCVEHVECVFSARLLLVTCISPQLEMLTASLCYSQKTKIYINGHANKNTKETSIRVSQPIYSPLMLMKQLIISHVCGTGGFCTPEGGETARCGEQRRMISFSSALIRNSDVAVSQCQTCCKLLAISETVRKAVVSLSGESR